MGDGAKPAGATPDRSEPLAAGLLPRLRRAASSALVAAGLLGVAYWGHQTDWTFAGAPRRGGPPPAPSAGLARVRLGKPVRPDLASPLRHEVSIEFDSADAVDGAGIAIAPAWPGATADAVEAPGEVQFDPALVARLAPRAPGPVWRVLKKAGDPVAAGEVLALVEATEAGRAKAEFQRALVQARLREKTLAALKSAAKVVSVQSVREGEAAVKSAETRLLAAAQALANLDLAVAPDDYRSLPPEVVVERMRLLGVPANAPGLDAGSATANLIPVRAPFAGVVLSANAVAGEVAQPGRAMFTVADPRRAWLVLAARADDAGRVKPGQPIRFRTDGAPDEVEGRVDWVAPAADESTRTVAVRAVVPNDGGRLRAGTLGQGRIVVRQEKQALLVPRAAVKTFRGAPVVFVRHPDYLKPGGPKAFTARPVRVGARDAESAEIVAGLERGEVVAAGGGELLLSELTRAIDGAKPDPGHVEEVR
jgi:cobalt-zinc-cadmium efflux system membrane fusion protein